MGKRGGEEKIAGRPGWPGKLTESHPRGSIVDHCQAGKREPRIAQRQTERRGVRQGESDAGRSPCRATHRGPAGALPLVVISAVFGGAGALVLSRLDRLYLGQELRLRSSPRGRERAQRTHLPEHHHGKRDQSGKQCGDPSVHNQPFGRMNQRSVPVTSPMPECLPRHRPSSDRHEPLGACLT